MEEEELEVNWYRFRHGLQKQGNCGMKADLLEIVNAGSLFLTQDREEKRKREREP